MDRRGESLVKLAEALATYYHEGQADKNGHDYIAHPRAVFYRIYADDMYDYAGQTVAWLHDTLEDTSLTEACLRLIFPPYFVNAVVLLSRNLSRPGDDYYRDIRKNGLALRVKLKDIEHNTSAVRLQLLDAKVQDRLVAKYAHALKILNGQES